jgi:copper transport protein
LLGAALGAILAAASVRAASAHALLLGADPGAGAVLSEPPAVVELRFSEDVSAAGPGITVLAPSGRLVNRGGVRVTARSLSVRTESAEHGTYLVRWAVIAQDTHPSRGQLTFSVGQSGPVPPGATFGSDVGAVSPAGLLLQTLGRWLHFVGLALGFGTLAFQVLARPVTDRRLDRLVLGGVAVLVLAQPVALVGQAVSLDLPPQDVLASSFGQALGLGLGGALVLWAAAGAVREAGRGRAAVLAFGVPVVLADGLAGHRILGIPDLATFFLGAVHEAAMAVWAGGLIAFLVVREGGHRFGVVALACVATLAVSGALLALAHLRSPSDVTNSAYAAVLGVKVIAVAATALVAWLGVRRVEAAALAGVLALAALLVSLPPPR